MKSFKKFVTEAKLKSAKDFAEIVAKRLDNQKSKIHRYDQIAAIKSEINKTPQKMLATDREFIDDILDILYDKYNFREEVKLDEKLKASDDMGDWVKDFQDSDAPQFKGKSQKKRREMAIAAKLDAERNEEVELEEAKSNVYHKHMLKALGKSRLPKNHSYTSAIANNGDFVVHDGGGRVAGRIPKDEHNLK